MRRAGGDQRLIAGLAHKAAASEDRRGPPSHRVVGPAEKRPDRPLKSRGRARRDTVLLFERLILPFTAGTTDGDLPCGQIRVAKAWPDRSSLHIRRRRGRTRKTVATWIYRQHLRAPSVLREVLHELLSPERADLAVGRKVVRHEQHAPVRGHWLNRSVAGNQPRHCEVRGL